MKVKLLGDPLRYTKNLSIDMPTVALGDLSLGNHTRMWNVPQSRQFSFIFGDEDSKFAAINHDRCLGNFGYLKHWNMFFVSGTDRDRSSEIADHHYEKCLNLYSQIKPRVVITHDAPINIINKMFGVIPEKNQTTDLYDQMLSIHNPQTWVFAHWKKDQQIRNNRTQFVCLDSHSEMVMDL